LYHASSFDVQDHQIKPCNIVIDKQYGLGCPSSVLQVGKVVNLHQNIKDMKPNIDILDEHRSEIAGALNQLLADEYILYTKTRNAHWNITGPNFMELHKFFESQYDTLDDTIDNVAERVRALGHTSLGSLKDFLTVGRLLETPLEGSNPKSVLQALLDDHETLIRILRHAASVAADTWKDLGTADFLTGLLEQHEKMAGMLRAYLS
jgi:starvation-inducible DNA-binding protein